MSVGLVQPNIKCHLVIATALLTFIVAPSSCYERFTDPGCNNYTLVNVCAEGNTKSSVFTKDATECCAQCTSAGKIVCTHFTFNSQDGKQNCRLKTGDFNGQGKENKNCTTGYHAPKPYPPAPPSPPPAPPNPNAPRPHIVMVIADDLGFYDTEVYNENSPTPNLLALSKSGMRLDRHYVFRYCSPTRRSFLSGRFPNHITTVQPDGSNLCSDFLPLAVQTVAEKLAKAGYQNHYVGKGHLGYETMDHLPINRGFLSHVGYLGGAESYFWGGGKEDPLAGSHDMWHDHKPGIDIVPEIFYSANFYATTAVNIVKEFDVSKGPLFMYLAEQNVHSPYQDPPAWEDFQYPKMWDNTYANMLHMLDVGVDNVTKAMKAKGMWNDTLLVFTADNGGVGKNGNNYPLRGHKHDPWEGGTRATAFIAGGFVPMKLRGTNSGDKFVHVSDWYATFCTLAGIDYHDYAYLEGKLHDVDSVNVWPLLTGENATQPRPMTPTTETSLVYTTENEWWKLVTLAGQSNYYSMNGSQFPGNDTCLTGGQPDPPQPGRTDPIVNGICVVCNSSFPCLYDIKKDPAERNNIAMMNPDIVKMLTPVLAESLQAYVTGHLPQNVIDANYTKIDPKTWQGYSGPCYARKNTTEIGN